MGTNYYSLVNVCEHCGREAEKIHLGKSSVGWAFSFRGYNGGEASVVIQNIDQWLEVVRKHDYIVDEYGDKHDTEWFIDVALGKGGRHHAEVCERTDPHSRMVGKHSFTFTEFS
jgi:hypothetical protein